jgi:hypothetical protein
MIAALQDRDAAGRVSTHIACGAGFAAGASRRVVASNVDP